ncbi:succinate--CoA ligase subunit alpha [Pseudodesulfovibrio senegalensis]|uniref:Succinate--CoA ligase subunit alpha n=1 Tax=Pseudodesulfovibrio senegalensis TaxID=1721087 RepID=A0A6N6MZG5_9BACT|nr:succinate--CoA ligase subunit alpha [Pseudodesulfovibrio senegalensis]KAB1441091.1 succinate--CoA ligase subunit alpha [Pseudodesulfovibrio senegalensis]
MLLNEHKSKTLFQRADIAIPLGTTITPKTLEQTAPDMPLPWFLKAQVLAKGRGKAGGILRINTPEELVPTARRLFDLDINGHPVPLIRVESATDIKREFYISLTISRERRCILLTVGREGGMDIESLGAENLLIQEIRLPAGLQACQVRAAFFHLELEKKLLTPFHKLLTSLFTMMLDNGLLLAEINPLVLTESDEFVALDGKVEMDDNFVELNPDMEEYYQPEHASKEENEAREAGLSFVKLPGWVGLVVNGAGLAMATMDLLNFSGLSASNFLDLGGAADRTRMATALRLLFDDTAVKAIFINMFGGILSCEKVARALEDVLDGRQPRKPIVARMAGKDSEQGQAVLREMNVQNLHVARDMAQAMEILASLKPENAPKVDFPAPMGTRTAKPQKATGHVSAHNFGIDKDTPILVQGITGKVGQMHTTLMQEYGANIVAGVTPFKGGQTILGVPVYDSVEKALRHHEIGASIIFVPPRMAADAVVEAAVNHIPWAICITEGIIQQDMLSALWQVKDSPTRIVGPNTPGLIVPGQTKIGILPPQPFTPGPVAIISRSGTLTYEVAQRLTNAGIGQSLGFGIGGDPFIGTSFVDMFEMLRNHAATKAVVVLGEIGGTAEEDLAHYVMDTGFDKPVISFVAGQTAPPGKRLGHAGAILQQGGSTQSKLETMAEAGFVVCESLEIIPELTAKILDETKEP